MAPYECSHQLFMRIFKGVTMMRQDPLLANIQHLVFSDIEWSPIKQAALCPVCGWAASSNSDTSGARPESYCWQQPRPSLQCLQHCSCAAHSCRTLNWISANKVCSGAARWGQRRLCGGIVKISVCGYLISVMYKACAKPSLGLMIVFIAKSNLSICKHINNLCSLWHFATHF